MSSTISLTVNGTPEVHPSGITIAGLLTAKGIDPRTVAVEVDLDIVDRSEFSNRTLISGCSVEVVRFVGGG